MFDISIIDKGYSSKKKSSYELSILVSRDGFSFLLFDPKKNEVAVFKHVDFDAVTYEDLLNELRKILITEKLLQQTFPRVKVMYHNTSLTLLPNDAIQEENLKQYLSFQHPINELDEIHYREVPGHRAQAVFALPNYLGNEIIEIHNRAQFYHPCIPLIEMALKKSKKHQGNLVLINKALHFFDLIIIKNHKLFLYNTFNFRTENDFVYYVMSSYKQLNLESTHIPYYVCGLIRPENKDYQLLEKFLGQLSTNIIPSEISNLKQLERTISPFMFASLFGLSLCE